MAERSRSETNVVSAWHPRGPKFTAPLTYRDRGCFFPIIGPWILYISRKPSAVKIKQKKDQNLIVLKCHMLKINQTNLEHEL